jgi:hypothetical protein
MLVPPPAARDPEEKEMMQRRSRGPRLSMMNPMACFSSASFVPTMLPLTSSTVTRSSSARRAADWPAC